MIETAPLQTQHLIVNPANKTVKVVQTAQVIVVNAHPIPIKVEHITQVIVVNPAK